MVMYEKYLSLHSVPAGAILKQILGNKNISRNEIANKSSIPYRHVMDLIVGRRKFTSEYSRRLEKALDISTPGYFCMIQANYEKYLRADEQERKHTPDLSKLHKALFWETYSLDINWIKNAEYVVKRVFEYGNKTEIEEIIRFYGREKVAETLNSIPATDTWTLKDRNKNRQLFGI